MSKAVFIQAAKEIEMGRPIYALTLADRYFESSHPLRMALGMAAKQSLAGVTSPEAQKLIKGERLSSSERSTLSAIIEVRESSTKFTFNPERSSYRGSVRRRGIEGRRRIAV